MDQDEVIVSTETAEAEEEISGVNYYEVILDEFRDYITEDADATVGLVISSAKIAEGINGLSEDVGEVTAIATDILESEAAMKKEVIASVDAMDDAVKEIDADVDDVAAKVKALEAKISALESKCAAKSAVAFCAVASAVAAIAAIIGLFV